MSILEGLPLIWQFVFEGGLDCGWPWVIVTIFGFVLLLHWLWGRCWNGGWDLFRPKPLAISLILGLAAGYAVFNWRAVSGFEKWLEFQREGLADTLTGSRSFHRNAFETAWDKLQPLGGQDGLIDPREGGEEIHLRNLNEAAMLASAAATEARALLRGKVPFAQLGRASNTNPDAVGQDVAATLGETVSFPLTVNVVNEWQKAAATAQVHQSASALFKDLEPVLLEVRRLAMAVAIGLAVLMLVVVPVFAMKDIRVFPRLDRN